MCTLPFKFDIGRIARQLGYGSLSHFSGQFTHRTGRYIDFKYFAT